MNRPKLENYLEDGCSYSTKGSKRFIEDINKYCDELESIINDETLFNKYVEINTALNIICDWLAKTNTCISLGNSTLCSNKSGDYYKFLIGGNNE